MTSTAPLSEPLADRIERRRIRNVRLMLCVISGMLLGFSFPPSPFGVLACFALVPLLIVLADLERIRESLGYTYVAMLVFHLITLNWTGGYAHGRDMYMMIAGGLTMTIHPLFYFLPIASYVAIKKYHGHKLALVALPFLWVGYEYSHTLSEWSFPWLSLGNSQTYDLARIQIVNVTGVLGLSFWILVMNVLAFVLYSKVAGTGWNPLSRKSLLLTGFLVLVYFLPSAYGWAVLSRAPAAGVITGQDSLRVGIIQPNIDPWEKWTVSHKEALGIYLRLTKEQIASHRSDLPDLVLWPETALPFPILLPANYPLLEEMHATVDSMGVSVLTGFPHYVLRSKEELGSSAVDEGKPKRRYNTYNAAMLIQPHVQKVEWYGKMKMVPLAERIPYAEVFSSFDFLRWGVGLGGWNLGPDSTIFVDARTGARFNTLICYESTYPAFVASFVRKGSEFIALITIDSWWDRMSGAYQHQQFAILRAVENRRWIARCAVGGFSCFIDPYGRVLDKTELFTKDSIVRTLERKHERTYYTEHGDVVGELSLVVGGLFVAAAIAQHLRIKQRKSP